MSEFVFSKSSIGSKSGKTKMSRFTKLGVAKQLGCRKKSEEENDPDKV